MKLQIQKAHLPEIVEAPVTTIAEVTEKAMQLERILGEIATPEKVKQWLLDICEAEDMRRTAAGEEWSSPDWDARIKGLDRVMAILHMAPSKEPKMTINQPTKILIQVIDNKPAA